MFIEISGNRLINVNQIGFILLDGNVIHFKLKMGSTIDEEFDSIEEAESRFTQLKNY